MELSLHALDQIVNPLELVHLLAEDLHVENDSQYSTKCPKCDSKLFILDNEFVCENANCFFKAGSCIDYLVAKNICNWDNAIDTLNKILDDNL